MFLSPGSSIEELVRLTNAANTLPFELLPTDLYAGKPKVLPNGSVELPLVTMYDSVYEGYVKLTYKRIDLSKVFGGIKPVVHEIGSTTLHKLLPVISQAIGVYLTPADVIDTNINWLGSGEQVNLQITATPESLGFTGTFVVQFNRIRPHLNTIPLTTLDALRHPSVPPEGKRCLDMVTWSLDFTDQQQFIRPYYSFTWADYGSVKRIMGEFGFANWPNAGQGDLRVWSTKDLPEANPEFTTVVTQRGVVGPDYAGTAYFHYNRS